jgi:uncharacterized protein (DUF427 family)
MGVMAVRLREVLMGELGALRYEPTDKRIRALIGDTTVVDSTRALLVWEPRRVVPTYAIPVEDIAADLEAATEPIDGDRSSVGVVDVDAPQLGALRVFDPSVPFALRTTEGDAVTLRVAGTDRSPAGFRPADSAFDGFVVLDYAAFDRWYEEDEANLGHPRDPFHAIDIVHSSRHVVVRIGDTALAESTSPCLLFEPPLPVRYYLPREDVRRELLQPSDTQTTCAYKGRASYWSFGDEDDIVWSYPTPLRQAAEIAGRLAFMNERVDIVVDGVELPRPVTPWSRRDRAPDAG